MNWEMIAKSGRIDDAIVAYVKENDWVTFPELQREFAPYLKTEGEFTVELAGNIRMWVGMSEEFVTIIRKLDKDKRIFYHSADVLLHMIDGGILTLPVVKRKPPAQGYKKPHWLPVAIRAVPIP